MTVADASFVGSRIIWIVGGGRIRHGAQHRCLHLLRPAAVSCGSCQQADAYHGGKKQPDIILARSLFVIPWCLILLCRLAPTVASTSLALIGLANIFGSLCVGHLVNVYRSKSIRAKPGCSTCLPSAWA